VNATTLNARPNHFFPLVLLAGFAAFLLFGRGCAVPAPYVPVPPPAAGPDMVRAFSTNDNRAEAMGHCHALETILDAAADVLEYDGKLPEPRIRTGVQWDDFRRALRENRMQGFSFGYRYPDLKNELESWFDKTAGTSGGPLDVDKDGKPADRRRQWIEACRGAAASCRYARSLE
jgi:hypothetical protein